MQTNFHLYPPEYDRTTKQPMKDFGFIESLKIDSMVVLIKESYRGFADLSLENYFSTDEQVLDYRLGVVEDLVNNPNLYETFGKAVSMIYNINDMRRAMSSEFTIDSSLRSVRYLELYVEIVTLFADNLSQAALQSEGMKNFQKEINGIAQSSEFQTLSSELSKMETNFGYLKSVTLGINLDGNLCPMEAGYIATEVLTGIGIIGCCGLYVTHIHDLTQHLDVYNSHPENRGKIDNLVAMMESKEEGTRSYKVIRTTPDGLSYAKDIARRYRLDLEDILKNCK